MWLKYAQVEILSRNAWSNLFGDTGYDIAMSVGPVEKLPLIWDRWGDVLSLLSPDVRFLAAMFLLLGNDAQYLKPGSENKRNHPPEDLKPGGQFAHEKKVVAQALHLLEALGISPESKEFEAVILGALLHDYTKHGLPRGFKGDAKPHGHDLQASQVIGKIAPSILSVITSVSPKADDVHEILEMAMDAVANHSGPWRPDVLKDKDSLGDNDIARYQKEARQNNPVAYVVHMADFITTRNARSDSSFDQKFPGLSEETISNIQKSAPELTERSQYVRNFSEALNKIEEVSQNAKSKKLRQQG